jgi:hypothetical protein
VASGGLLEMQLHRRRLLSTRGGRFQARPSPLTGPANSSKKGK